MYRYFAELSNVIHAVVIRDSNFEPSIPRHKTVYIWDAPYIEQFHLLL